MKIFKQHPQWWKRTGTVLSPNVSGDRMDITEIRAISSAGLKLYEDGGSGIFIKDGGNVGIGTTTPNKRLHLAGLNSDDYAQIDTGLNFDSVTAPASAGFSVAVQAVAGNIDAGDHYYSYTFVTAIGETSIMRVPNGPHTFDAAHGQAVVTVPVSTDYRVTKRYIYRTKAGAGQYYLYKVGEIANNTGTSFTDNVADAGLGTAWAWYRPDTTNAVIMIDGSPAFFADTYLTAMGVQAGNVVKENGGYYNTMIGVSAGRLLTTGSMNTFIGAGAGYNRTTQAGSVMIGEYAGYDNLGSSAVIIGTYAASGMAANQITGAGNVLIGDRVAYDGDGAAANNVVLGRNAGYKLVGSNNVFLGNRAGYYETGSSKLFIDSLTRASEADGRIKALVYGVFHATALSQQITFNVGTLNILDGGNIATGITTGLKIGTATNQKLGFYNATPVDQPATVADATDAGDVILRCNDIIDRLQELGLIA